MNEAFLTKDVLILVMTKYATPRDAAAMGDTCRVLRAQIKHPTVRQCMRVGIEARVAEEQVRTYEEFDQFNRMRHRFNRSEQERPAYYQCSSCYAYVKHYNKDHHEKKCRYAVMGCNKCRMSGHLPSHCQFDLVRCLRCSLLGPRAVIRAPLYCRICREYISTACPTCTAHLKCLRCARIDNDARGAGGGCFAFDGCSIA